MAIKRAPDGKMIDEPTRAVTRPGATIPGAADDQGPTARPATGALGRDYDAPTVKGPTRTSPLRRSEHADAESLDPATRIMGRGSAVAASAASNAMDDPPVGWLVVIEGPGCGEVLQLGYGRNSIGRGEDVRLKLDFGDEEISRSPHCSVTYDPRSKRFFLAHEQGVNLTYLKDEPVLQPMLIEADARISIGTTILRFVPFCDPAFDWHSEG